jgi:hypothetical protein
MAHMQIYGWQNYLQGFMHMHFQIDIKSKVAKTIEIVGSKHGYAHSKRHVEMGGVFSI